MISPPPAIYRRGQVIRALWEAYGPDAPRVATVPPAFTTRVRKFGEFGVPGVARPCQRGVDIGYSSFDAFEIGVAIDMQDAGLNQAEIGFFVHNARALLRQAFDYISKNEPPLIPGFWSAANRPSLPHRLYVRASVGGGIGKPTREKQADTSVFLSFRCREVQEAYSSLDFVGTNWSGKGRHPFFTLPKLHFGLTELVEEIDLLTERRRDRSRIIFELSGLFALITEGLRSAPLLKRGRQ